MIAVAVVGISGVGKTTFLKKAMGSERFLHLEASALIKEQIGISQQVARTSEELRNGPILDNQLLLVEAFERRTSNYDNLVILDGHTIVDTGSELQRIPSWVFERLKIRSMIFLQDAPGTIFARRANDTARIRPKRSEKDIASHQKMALETTAEIALELDIAMHIVTHRSGAAAISTLVSLPNNQTT